MQRCLALLQAPEEHEEERERSDDLDAVLDEHLHRRAHRLLDGHRQCGNDLAVVIALDAVHRSGLSAVEVAAKRVESDDAFHGRFHLDELSGQAVVGEDRDRQALEDRVRRRRVRGVAPNDELLAGVARRRGLFGRRRSRLAGSTDQVRSHTGGAAGHRLVQGRRCVGGLLRHRDPLRIHGLANGLAANVVPVGVHRSARQTWAVRHVQELLDSLGADAVEGLLPLHHLVESTVTAAVEEAPTGLVRDHHVLARNVEREADDLRDGLALLAIELGEAAQGQHDGDRRACLVLGERRAVGRRALDLRRSDPAVDRQHLLNLAPLLLERLLIALARAHEDRAGAAGAGIDPTGVAQEGALGCDDRTRGELFALFDEDVVGAGGRAGPEADAGLGDRGFDGGNVAIVDVLVEHHEVRVAGLEAGDACDEDCQQNAGADHDARRAIGGLQLLEQVAE